MQNPKKINPEWADTVFTVQAVFESVIANSESKLWFLAANPHIHQSTVQDMRKRLQKQLCHQIWETSTIYFLSLYSTLSIPSFGSLVLSFKVIKLDLKINNHHVRPRLYEYQYSSFNIHTCDEETYSLGSWLKFIHTSWCKICYVNSSFSM